MEGLSLIACLRFQVNDSKNQEKIFDKGTGDR